MLFTKSSSGKGSTYNAQEFEVRLVLYIFRGEPDTYYKRHVLVYFTSPQDKHFHHTVHIRREYDNQPWDLDWEDASREWFISPKCIDAVDAGRVITGQESKTAPVEIVAGTKITDRELQTDFNCQSFLLEGFKQLVIQKYQTDEWYDNVEEELIEKLLRDAIG